MSVEHTNPLLQPGLPRFDRILPEHALEAITHLIGQYRDCIETITALDADHMDFDNTLWAEAHCDEALSNAWSTVGHLNRVANTPAWREAFQACLPEVATFSTERAQNQALYRVYEILAQRPDFVEQDPAIQAAVQHQLRDFKLAGVDQPAEIRDELKSMSLRLSELSNTFGNQVMDATEGYWVHFDAADALAGLPEDALAQMAERAKSKDMEGYVADLSFPSYKAIITYADDRALREQFYEAFATRASDQGPQSGQWDNTPIVIEMLHLRHQMATRLGFEHHAAHRLETRMADSVASIEAFLRDLAQRARPMAEAQVATLEAFSQSLGGPSTLAPWDVAYYSEKLKDQTLGINDEHLKPYFEVDRVFRGLFETATELFGLRFERDDTVWAWHEQVRYYRVYDASGEEMAGLYLDIYAREKKASGAWMDVCRSRFISGDHRQYPVAYLTCNFAPPSPDRPSLLTHDDVVTLFHEFGHCLHHLLTRVDLPAVAGIHGVEWDAVELPSQLLEGWSLSEEALMRYARHIETNEPLSSDDLQAIRGNRQFQGALALLRQIQFALSDLALHQSTSADPIDVVRAIEDAVSVMPSPAYNRFLMSFSHLFNGGYSAGYYSYLWAERLARDAFDLFEQEGMFNTQLGERLAQTILSVGGSRPMDESWLEFMGRPARLEPLLAAYGIHQEAA